MLVWYMVVGILVRFTVVRVVAGVSMIETAADVGLVVVVMTCLVWVFSGN